jgi:hypothetical protein
MNAVVPALAPQITVMNPLDVLMTSINTNPYFIGLMMLLLNLGGRFLSLEISKEQEKFLSQPMVRRFFLFAVLFVATRNIVIAAGLAFIVILLLGYLFNENSSLCMWKSCVEEPMTNQPEQTFVGLTPEEAMILKRLQDKQMAAKQAETNQEEGEEKKETKKPPTASSVYQKAVQNLKKLS